MKKYFILNALCFIIFVISGCVEVITLQPLQTTSAPAETIKRLDSKKEQTLIESLDDRMGVYVSNGHDVNYEKHPDGYGLGFSKQYQPFDKMSWATVFFFHGRMDNLKDGIESPELKKMFADSIVPAQFSGSYNEMKDPVSSTVKYNGIPFRRFQFTGTRKDSNRETMALTFLTVFNGTFFKVRLDYYTEHREGERDVEDFMNAITKQLKSQKSKN